MSQPSNEYKGSVRAGNLIIQCDEEQLSVAPGEVDKLLSLLHTADLLAPYKVLPNKIEDPPYRIEFLSAGGVVIHNIINNDSLPSCFGDIDKVQTLIKSLFDQYRNETAHGSGPKISISDPTGPGDVLV